MRKQTAVKKNLIKSIDDYIREKEAKNEERAVEDYSEDIDEAEDDELIKILEHIRDQEEEHIRELKEGKIE